MANSMTEKNNNANMTKSVIQCPHCGVKLSSWEQVLLNVDRVLMCKNCWYRIILDVNKAADSNNNKSKEKQ